MVMIALTLKNISKSFAREEVLKDVSFEVEEGQLLAILGPSGCGKTTTLRIIAGLEVPDNGEVWFGDRLASSVGRTKISQRDRKIGMVFQDLALWPHMTVEKNVEFGLKARKMSRSERKTKVREVLSKVKLERYMKSYPSNLSGGQQQLVAIARAVAIEPKLILMDEPLSNLDVRLRGELRKEIMRLQRELGVTTIYVTHDQEEAFILSGRIVVMNDGYIEQVGTPEELYKNPKSKFVAGFIGKSTTIDGIVLDKSTIETSIGIIYCETVMAKGQIVTAVIRPEHITFVGSDKKDKGVLCGKIAQRSYLGDKYTYTVSVSGNLQRIPTPSSPFEGRQAVKGCNTADEKELFVNSNENIDVGKEVCIKFIRSPFILKT